MPWTCCGGEHLDDVSHCPQCGQRKSKWTLRFDRTRRFVVPKKTAYEHALELGEEEEPDYEDELELGEEEPGYEDELELGAEEPAVRGAPSSG